MEKEPTERHTGDTCCTVKTTLARCRKTNVSVMACRLLPFVPIHARDARRVVTAGRPAGPAAVRDVPVAPPATPGDVPPELPGPGPVPPAAGDSPIRGDELVPPEDVAAETDTWGVVTLGAEALGVVATGVVTRGAETDGVVTAGTVTDGVLTGGGGGGGGGEGVVTDGVVTVVTGGTGTVTLGTVAVGTVGGGTRSAWACSARTPSPKTRTRMAAPLTPVQLRCR
jgi:hypothetical protein